MGLWEIEVKKVYYLLRNEDSWDVCCYLISMENSSLLWNQLPGEALFLTQIDVFSKGQKFCFFQESTTAYHAPWNIYRRFEWTAIKAMSTLKKKRPNQSVLQVYLCKSKPLISETHPFLLWLWK